MKEKPKGLLDPSDFFFARGPHALFGSVWYALDKTFASAFGT